MRLDSHHHGHAFRLTLVILSSSSCASEEAAREIAARGEPLELACADTPPHVSGDSLAILSSIDPFDPSRPQVYGSDACGGFVFEFDNAFGEAFRGAWVHASGQSNASSDMFGESQCPERRLEVDYWGYEKRKWSKRASSSTSGSFEPGAIAGEGHCRIEAVFDEPSTLEKYRIVARVTDGSETYPMLACLW